MRLCLFCAVLCTIRFGLGHTTREKFIELISRLEIRAALVTKMAALSNGVRPRFAEKTCRTPTIDTMGGTRTVVAIGSRFPALVTANRRFVDHQPSEDDG